MTRATISRRPASEFEERERGVGADGITDRLDALRGAEAVLDPVALFEAAHLCAQAALARLPGPLRAHAELERAGVAGDPHGQLGLGRERAEEVPPRLGLRSPMMPTVRLPVGRPLAGSRGEMMATVSPSAKRVPGAAVVTMLPSGSMSRTVVPG